MDFGERRRHCFADHLANVCVTPLFQGVAPLKAAREGLKQRTFESTEQARLLGMYRVVASNVAACGGDCSRRPIPSHPPVTCLKALHQANIAVSFAHDRSKQRPVALWANSSGGR